MGPGFAFGKSFALGECYGEVIRVTQSYFDKYGVDPENPVACLREGNRLSRHLRMVGESLLQHIRHQPWFHGKAESRCKLRASHECRALRRCKESISKRLSSKLREDVRSMR